MRVAALLLFLAATLALSCPTTARALLSDPKPDGSCGCCATRQVGFMWSTDSATSLDYADSSLEHGILVGTPISVPASSTDLRTGCFESNGFMTGVEGTVTMSVAGSEGCKIGVYFDNPFLGDNAWSCESSCSQYACQLKQTNSDKLHPTLRVTVTKSS